MLTRDQLLDLSHHRGWEPFDRSIDVRITRLRRKIESEPSRPQLIKTVRGAGYIFSPPVNHVLPYGGTDGIGTQPRRYLQ